MANTTIIPTKINVGFQKRSDTYTGQLGYVIYFDQKGVLRKETSWQKWRDKNIPNREFENTPTEGFVLNKTAGGGRGWDGRRPVCRIYDPRGFEFEIGMDNLLYILANTDCVRGKGLVGKFVYGWNGNTLILIPEQAPEYLASTEYTQALGGKVEAKDLVPGGTYRTKKNDHIVYMGHFKYGKNGPKRYYFIYPTAPYGVSYFAPLKDNIIQRIGTEIVYNFADLMDILETDERYSPVDPTKCVYVKATEADLESLSYSSYQKFYVESQGRHIRIELGKQGDMFSMSQMYVHGYPITEDLAALRAILPLPDPDPRWPLTHYRRTVSSNVLLNTFNLLVKKYFLENGKERRKANYSWWTDSLTN